LSEIKLLKTNDTDIVRHYLYKNFWSCIEIIKTFEKSGLRQDLMNKDAGVYYGYFYENILSGLLVFTNNKKMMVHYMNEDILKKVDLLKAIRYHKPEYFTGVSVQSKNIWKVFERTIKRYNYKESQYMVCDRKTFEEPTTSFKIRPAHLEDGQKNIGFFMHVEREFKRRHMTVNQLKDRIKRRHNTKEYLVAEVQGHVIGQGFIEEKIHGFWQIGGVYTSPLYRGLGVGESLMKTLMKVISENGCIPVLAVLKSNDSAIKLYNKIGFNAVVDYSIYEIEY
jgi:predicted GNAT family acetyltransferase